MKKPSLNTVCAIALGFTLAGGVYMWTIAEFRRRPLPDDLTSPVVALQLVKSDADVVRILGDDTPPNRDWETTRRVQKADGFLLFGYAASLIAVGCTLWRREHHLVPQALGRTLAVLLGVLVVAAAACDFFENRAIGTILGGSLVESPRPWAIWKWGTFFSAVAIASVAFLERGLPVARRVIGFAAALFCIKGAAAGLTGLWQGADLLIESGAGAVGPIIALAFLFFATHRMLADGVLGLFDHLSTWRLLKDLTNWPSDGDEGSPA